MKVLRNIVGQLETPRAERPFGSGWLSGSLSVLAGIAGLLLVLLHWYPETMSFPDLDVVTGTGVLTIAMRVILLLGYVLAFISLALARNRTLGLTGLALSVGASLMTSAQPVQLGEMPSSIYFGLDYFIVNVLLVGFLFVPLERMFPARPEQTVLRQEWQEDMFYYLLSSMLVQVLTFLTMAPSNFVNLHFDLTSIRGYIGSLPFAVQVILIMLATDFVEYWVHRTFHTVPFLWRFHAIHHSAKKMDWLAGARMHFMEIAVLRGLTAVPMFTLGFRPEAIQGYLLIVYFSSSFIHSNINWNLGWLERFIVTPRFHHWHHGSDREAIDINYASHFPIYDWLFGTHHLPEGRWPEQYGVVGDNVPRGYWKQFLHPFTRDKKDTPAE